MGRYWNGWRAAVESSLAQVDALIAHCRDEAQLGQLQLKRARLQQQLDHVRNQTERF